MQGGALYDSLETETLYNEATGPSNRMFNELSQLPKVYDFTAALNAFSCYLNKHNACRFVVDPTYETPTPEEIQVVRAGGHSDTFSTAAYYAFQEEEYLKTVQKPQLPTLPFNIVSEFTGPLRLFADYMGVSVNEASVMFMNVNKAVCIDETLYDTIQYCLWFCMADSVPAPVEVPTSTVENTIPIDASKKRIRDESEENILSKPPETPPRPFKTLRHFGTYTASVQGGRTFRRRLPTLN